MKTKMMVVMLGVILFMTACGNQEVSEITETMSQPIEDVPDTSMVEKENGVTDILTPESEEDDLKDGDLNNATDNNEVSYAFNSVTKIKTIGDSEIVKPYFVGRDNYEENVGYFNQHLTEETGKLYIKKKMYLPDMVVAGTVYCTVSDEQIAKIEGNALIGLEQGSVTLTCYDEDMNILDEKVYIVSTYNDSVEDIAKHLSINKANIQNNYSAIDMRDVHYCREAVSTIMDMSYLLQMRGFTYDFTKEPDFGALNYNVSDEEKWNWTADAETIFDMNGGVCIQVAQLAIYMLADDFEDWGVVMIEGRQGHIFNWFFEDGKYYVFDYTEVISDNCNRGYEFEQRFGYKDYSTKVKVFDNVEDFKDWCITSKVDITQNYAVFMYSCQGHDFLPTNINSVMSDSWGVVDGEKDKVLLCYQDIVMEDLEVFFLMENSNAEFVSIPTSEMPEEIPYGVYGRGEREYYYDYKK